MTEPSTPLMRQYAAIEKQHPTALLFDDLGQAGLGFMNGESLHKRISFDKFALCSKAYDSHTVKRSQRTRPGIAREM